MRNLSITLLCVTALFTSTAQAEWYKDWLKIFKKGTPGTGMVKEEIYELTHFSGVSLAGSHLLIIKPGRKAQLSIKTDENLLEHLIPQYEGNILKLKSTEKVKPTHGIIYTLTTPNIQSIAVSGSGTVETDGFNTQNLTISINGSGVVKLSELQVDNLSTYINGSGDCYLGGTAVNQSVTIRGSGDLDATKLSTNQSSVTIYGSGDVKVNVDKALDVKIYGSGEVNYSGDAKLSQSIIGSGTIRQI